MTRKYDTKSGNKNIYKQNDTDGLTAAITFYHRVTYREEIPLCFT